MTFEALHCTLEVAFISFSTSSVFAVMLSSLQPSTAYSFVNVHFQVNQNIWLLSKRVPRAWPNNGKYNKVTGEIAAPGHKTPYINSFNVVLHFKSNNMRQASTSAHSFYIGVNQNVNVYNKYLYVQKLNVVHLIEWICKLYFKERLSLMGQGHYVLSREKAFLFTYHSN